ncbi:MAG: flavin reductase family protein [Rhizomicrobium sp.]|nr:flavin reductase family protein [Rhizomicrobium sp.]
MDFDTVSFRKALGCFPTGIAVVTAGEGAEAKGITVNSFTSVSLKPPLVLWCLGKNSSRYEIFTKPVDFTISILSEAERAISTQLASGPDCSLTGLPLVEMQNGAPGIAGALTILECQRETIHDAGDHIIILASVLRFTSREDGAPLVYFRGRYGALMG